MQTTHKMPNHISKCDRSRSQPQDSPLTFFLFYFQLGMFTEICHGQYCIRCHGFKKKMQCYLPAIYHLVIKTMLDSPNSKHCRTMTTTRTCTVQILSAAGIWRKRSPSCLPRQGGCELDLRAFFWVFLLRFHISEVQTSRSSVDTNKQKNKLLAPSSWRFPRFQRLALLVNLTSSSLLNFSKSLLCRERGRRNH